MLFLLRRLQYSYGLILWSDSTGQKLSISSTTLVSPTTKPPRNYSYKYNRTVSLQIDLQQSKQKIE